ncbi:MAG: response regulator [Candidatus Scalindua rubra]|uniref:Two-component response regulator n=1 Tax=Candidatus Scalindua brodae TaxID=237368 RepID=A0A0B0ENU0_9BACT|nr:MAG: two-component response regulator [Candidatus Scalindua brodae]MBZ0108042.1 response regulator [Candidatus Scalindua rubra]TWU33939.1 Transcriptional regulatory protein ZraR [Candidatus Brocadiaceae bacterium S225]
MSKILIVDDNVNACFLLKSFLEEMDHNVIMSYCGSDALEKVKNLKPDIMLLDIIMEGMGGMEVLRRVRLFDKNIGIIMVSGLIDEAFCEESLENGADEYITKPFDYKHLNECILVDLIMRNKE